MPRAAGHANHPGVTARGGQIAGSAADGASEWLAVRHTADIQFAPMPRVKPASPPAIPGWLEALLRGLEAIFAPIGRMLGLSWPVFQYVLIGLAVLLAAYLLWLLLAPLVARALARGSADAPEAWTPQRAEALALLEDADALAAQGRYGEAAHLLLRRSVGQIEAARPEWLVPASTAREIAALPMLPDAGRRAFATIATRVERSLFALRDLDAADWAAARGAYAEFARVALSA